MKDISFEKAMENLEQIVGKLETGNLPLETLLKQYEDGIKLVRICREKLNEAKGKIEKIVKNENGTFEKESFNEEKDK
ncbi:MAG: exodeoxyribonuclease VII small subunit [Candidatus Omnitrophota bacterium]|nr:exodeoxyribonuclease VII small subunit [Candidatus Omnitrophota bacterium]MBU1894763.1 exodeoxyribonuclease VII small subunit [Candidatus Omnitrophota bacterium]